MGANKHSIKIYAKEKRAGAKLALHLLKHPTKVLSLVLLGNNLVNIALAAVATLLTVRYFGEQAVFLSTIIVAFAVLFFCEIIPKSIAIRYPNEIAPKFSFFVYPLHILLKPIVSTINFVISMLNRLISRDHKNTKETHDIYRLRGAIIDSGKLLRESHSKMLLGILNLERMKVSDAMVPTDRVEGINLDDSMPVIWKHLHKTDFSHVVVYKENMYNCLGFINVKHALLAEEEMSKNGKSKKMLKELIEESEFVPENIFLLTLLEQLTKSSSGDANKTSHRSFVVDEYGSVVGIITLSDIVTRAVGFMGELLVPDRVKGRFRVSTGLLVRDINQRNSWDIGGDDPKKQDLPLRGLIQEYLDVIPEGEISLEIDGYRLETIREGSDALSYAKIWQSPAKLQSLSPDGEDGGEEAEAGKPGGETKEDGRQKNGKINTK